MQTIHQMALSYNPSNNMRSSKLDLSPYLFHFIKGYIADPMSDLRGMLKDRQIRSRSNKNYICFTSSPITQVGGFFDTKVHTTGKPLYQCYGLAFPRDLLINGYGARNVIYTDIPEQQYLSSTPYLWRCEPLDTTQNDWEWLREWRTPGSVFDFCNIPDENIIIITPTQKDLLKLVVRESLMEGTDYDPTTGEEYPELFEVYDRKMKGISLDRIREVSFLNDYTLMDEIERQVIGEDMYDEEAEQTRKDIAALNALIARENAWLFQKS